MTRVVEQAAKFQIADELCDGGIDFGMHTSERLVSVGVSIPMQERDVFGGDFDEAGTGFDESAGQQAAASEASGVVNAAGIFRFQLDIKGVAIAGTEQSPCVVHGSQQ